MNEDMWMAWKKRKMPWTSGKLRREGKGRSSREPQGSLAMATSDWDSKVTPGLHPRVIYYVLSARSPR